jgi:O-antigen/teichoic acid export membrane protein
MTRTRRFLGGVVLGYTHLALVTVVGLWMTPFLLGRLGQHTLGLWLIAQQVLGYLLLMDVGVTALLPRETAFATGRAGGVVAGAEAALDLPHVVARARQAIRWQMPLVVVAALGVWYWMPQGLRVASGPVAVLLAAVVVFFPARVFPAFLQGLQELPFLSRVQIGAWTVNTVATIGLVLAGANLYALVIGWSLGQAVTAGAAWIRISGQYRSSWPRRDVGATWSEVKDYLGQAVWISLAQVAQVFLTGSDMLLVGAVLGANAVVLYSCTGKLAMVLANHPQLIMQAATPALSEMRAGGDRAHLKNTSVALMLAMLTVSGLVGSVVLALNGSFVRWWVGPSQYGGQWLTLLFAVQLIVRHWNITLIYGLFCFGKERRISLTNLADGAASIAVGLVLIRAWGAAGAVLGSLAAVLVISLPLNLVALARETATTPQALVGSLWPWAWRFTLVGSACALLPRYWVPSGVLPMIVAGTAVTAIYAAVMIQGLVGGPLDEYARPRLIGAMAGWWPTPSSARP